VFGEDLTAAEVTYLMAEEWAVGAGDVLWRRSRLGLRFTPEEVERLAEFMAEKRPGAQVPAPVG
jgi:glycerol-3-phosphate dehydrogenase